MLEKDARDKEREAQEAGENPAASGWTETGGRVQGSQVADESNESGPLQGLGGPPPTPDTALGDHLSK